MKKLFFANHRFIYDSETPRVDRKTEIHTEAPVSASKESLDELKDKVKAKEFAGKNGFEFYPGSELGDFSLEQKHKEGQNYYKYEFGGIDKKGRVQVIINEMVAVNGGYQYGNRQTMDMKENIYDALKFAKEHLDKH